MQRGAIWIILVLILISVGCIEEMGYELKLKDETEKLLIDCESKAGALIPKTLELRTPGLTWELASNQKWQDGTEIKGIGVYFVKGKKEGQNTNYLYPDENSRSLIYSKEIIDDDGTSLGKRTFGIKPVLKPIGVTAIPLKSFSVQKFEIIKLNFVECEWLQKQVRTDKSFGYW